MNERLVTDNGLCQMASTEFCESQEDCYQCHHGKKIRIALAEYERKYADAEREGRVEIKPKFLPPKKLKDVYTDDDLIYAAYSRCDCGAGLAYPAGYSLRDINSFQCSDLLKGIRKEGVFHTEPLLFAFYEIKTENQPSVCGATTRPKGQSTQAEMETVHAKE